MKIEVYNTGSDLLTIYSKEIQHPRPICTIYEDDLCNHVLTDRQVKALENGTYIFNVSKSILFEHCKKRYL